METVTLRRLRKGGESAVSDMICTTQAVSDRKNYLPAFAGESITIAEHFGGFMKNRMKRMGLLLLPAVCI